MFEEKGDGIKMIDPKGKIICIKCHKSFPSEMALLAHSEIHKQKNQKNYQCSHCNFLTNDHNSFRRHNSKHAEHFPYKCQYCNYTSIQSTTYRKHIEKKHPEEVKNVLFKCSKCKFCTINKNKFESHQQKHNETEKQLPTTVTTAIVQEVPTLVREDDVLIIDLEKDDFPTATILATTSQNKIKVKSNLVLTDPDKYVNLSCSEFLHDILPNQISYTPTDNNLPLPPLIKTSFFAKMNNNDVDQQQDDIHLDSVLWTGSS